MKYALNLADDGRVLSATFAQFAAGDAVLVDEIPEGDISDYRYDGGTYVYDPVSSSTEPVQTPPTELEQLRADIDYIAMETGVEL